MKKMSSIRKREDGQWEFTDPDGNTTTYNTRAQARAARAEWKESEAILEEALNPPAPPQPTLESLQKGGRWEGRSQNGRLVTLTHNRGFLWCLGQKMPEEPFSRAWGTFIQVCQKMSITPRGLSFVEGAQK